MMNTAIIDGNDRSDYITGGNCTVHHVTEKILIIKHKMWEFCVLILYTNYTRNFQMYIAKQMYENLRGDNNNISMNRAKKL